MASRMRRLFTLRNAVRATGVAAVTTGAALYSIHRYINPPNQPHSHGGVLTSSSEEIQLKDLPSRDTMIKRLKKSTMRLKEEGVQQQEQKEEQKKDSGEEEMYDILVIGGGATGTGVALDAISRGLKVALVERDDFSSGTSSRSTKLIHGGVRYLEKAFTKLDIGQLHLVQDALRERRHLIDIAPHLSRPLPIIVPIYNSWPSLLFYAPYYYIGVKAYDFFAGDDGVLEPSYWITYHEAREKFPMLKSEGLKGGVVYFDGQHNDSRMCLGIAMTAAAKGAVMANHVEVTALTSDPATTPAASSSSSSKDTSTPAKLGRINGAVVKDNLSGESFTIRAKQVVNATGPFCDGIRKMADAKAQNMIAPSSGVHVVLSNQYSPEGMGLIIPETSDGRVIFLLPWEGSTVIGTTDSVSPITSLPRPYEHEIQFILKEVSKFLNHEVKRQDVDAAWSGIRPLAKDVHAKDTASTSRDHVIEHTHPGLTTIAGGKWTTYRKMAEDTVEAVLKENTKLEQQIKAAANKSSSSSSSSSSLSKYLISTSHLRPSQTLGVPLIGAAGWSLQLPTTLARLGFDKDVAFHLSHNYGDKSFDISKIVGREKSLNKRLANGYPFIEAEIVYAARYEYAFTCTDMISNRIRLGFLNSDAAYHSLPRVIALMARELNWDTSRKIVEYQTASKFLSTMNRKGRNPLAFSDPLKLNQTENRLRQVFDYLPFNESELSSLHDSFNSFDKDEDGHLSRSDVIKLVNQTEMFGLKNIHVSDSATATTATNKPTAKFLQQLDLLDKDDSISWEPFLFAVAASFHEIAPPKLQQPESTVRPLPQIQAKVVDQAAAGTTTSNAED